jgi:hypothetical protein
VASPFVLCQSERNHDYQMPLLEALPRAEGGQSPRLGQSTLYFGTLVPLDAETIVAVARVLRNYD